MLEKEIITLKIEQQKQGELVLQQQALIDKLTRMLFGQKSERFEAVSPIQLAIFTITRKIWF